MCAFSFHLWYTLVDAAMSDTLFCCKVVKKNTVLSPTSLHLHKFLTSSDSQFNVCCKQNEEKGRRKGGGERVEVFYKINKMAREGRKMTLDDKIIKPDCSTLYLVSWLLFTCKKDIN